MRSEPQGYTDAMAKSDSDAVINPDWYKHVELYEWDCPVRFAQLAKQRWGWGYDQVYRSGIIGMPSKLQARLIGDEMKKTFTEFPDEFENGYFIRSRKQYVQPVWDGKHIVGLTHVTF